MIALRIILWISYVLLAVFGAWLLAQMLGLTYLIVQVTS